ncbi:MAG TPA: sensor histidine kinase KdpD [Polyangiaceae bacterium]|nr:sensor histidine kinase KdpD [Polyangiaceae bacterium]
MLEGRPDPDELLRRVEAEEQRARRGKLTLFFGAAPGVGKTYAMLQAARAALAERRAVVVGVVETHGRFDTAALLGGLEILPRRKLAYRDVELEEFDLDAALARRPDVILVDELAHTNSEGSRHPKRWQDVDELLAAGIDVLSTMNVQHVESLNDVIAKVTGVVVRETVPDSVLERAHAIKLVDLPPDDLLERLREGKVYVPAQAQRAIENFFRKGNLIALRELALRQTAERVDAQMLAYRREQGIEQTWAVAEQLIVAVSPSPYSARLVRAARRMAAALHARWFAVHVEPRTRRGPTQADAARLAQNLRLAAQLGAEVVTLSGEDATDAILRFSRERNITKIIVGKPVVTRFRDRFRVSLVDRMVRHSGDIDVYVTAGDAADDAPLPEKAERRALHVPSLVSAAVVTALTTTGAWLLFGREQLADVVMIYLLGIMWVSSRYGLWPSVFAAFLAVAAFDFFFVPPFLTFAAADFSHTITFVVMFLVAIVISGLTERVRNQAEAARRREQQTRALYELSRELTGAQGSRRVLELGGAQLERAFEAEVTIFAPDAEGRLQLAFASVSPEAGEAAGSDAAGRDASIAQWVWLNRQEAGLGTSTLPSGDALYVPLIASGGIVGVLGLRFEPGARLDSIERRRQLDAFSVQLALAMERAWLTEQTEKARREVEAEQLRSSLLSSVSHDLRTPLAVITGAASTLLDGAPRIDEPTRRDLTQNILDEAERLNRLIRNLLDMTRLESGAVAVQKEWQPLEEVVGSALGRLERRLAGRSLQVDVPRDLPLVPFDAVLIEQVLINLLENSAKYGAGAIDITARAVPNEVQVEVADRGPGIPVGHEARIFEKFQRAVRAGSPDGVGLGLAICRAIVAAHGGRIWAQNREGGGASFRFALPLPDDAPRLAPLPPDQVDSPSPSA